MADGSGPVVDRERLVADLRALVRIRSVTGSEEDVVAWAATALRELGLAVEVVSPALADVRADPDWPGEEMPRTSLPVVIGRAGRADGRRLILSGHLDVVPPGDPATWTVDPWGGEVRDGALYGRGACDMKGGVAAILGAVRALAATGDLDRLEGSLTVVFVPSEEDGGQGTLAAIRAGVSGDLAVITEPSNLDVVVAHAGAITFRLTVPGRAAHASQRREGISALDKLFVLSRALEADEARRNEAETDPLMTALGLPYPTIIGIVGGGEWASTVLDRVTADGRYGVRLGQTAAEAEAGAAGGDRRGVRRRTRSCATTRPRSRSPAAGSGRPASRPTIRCRSGWRRRSKPSPAAGRRSSASRTGRTCRCSSTSARPRASSSGRVTSRSRTAPTSTSRSMRSRPARASWRRGSRAS